MNESYLRGVVEESVCVGRDVPLAEGTHPERFDLNGVEGG